ncbi:MAG: tripartite tricarboxylate transporter TctB family protein [Geminicoccaceae bacterium]
MQRLAPFFELGFWLALALIAFGLSFQFSGEVGTYQWGAASWPRAVILLMIIAALVNTWRARPAADTFEETDEGGSVFAYLGLFLIPLVYAWLLPRTGFYVTTPFFLAVYLLYVGERRWPVILATVVVISLVINLIFTKLFYVALPVGNWPGFYDVNNWLLTVIR